MSVPWCGVRRTRTARMAVIALSSSLTSLPATTRPGASVRPGGSPATLAGRIAGSVAVSLPLAAGVLPTLSARALTRRMPERLTGLTCLPAALALSIALIEAPTGIAYREVGRLAFRRLAFRARQRRANQTTMHGAVVVLEALAFDAVV